MSLPSSQDAKLQRKNYPNCGRLTVLQSSVTATNDPFIGLGSLIQLNFPSMPDSIELSRTVDYIVNQTITAPDGFHQYKATNPLSIPLSFKLHSFDKEFCPNGALSVMQAASLLHSFSLPISDANGRNTLSVTSQQVNPGKAPSKQVDSLNSRADTATSNYTITAEAGSNFAPPPTLRLDLIFIDANTPGIICVGYIKDLKVKLNGPFLRGPNHSYGLPTSADFEFTFVHVPGYGNDWNIANSSAQKQVTLTQAFADDVKEKLFNTIDLSKASGVGFRGFNKF